MWWVCDDNDEDPLDRIEPDWIGLDRIGWERVSVSKEENKVLTPRWGGDHGDGHHHGCDTIMVVTRDGCDGIPGFGRVFHHQMGGRIHHDEVSMMIIMIIR